MGNFFILILAFGAIFRDRLKDVAFVEDGSTVIFKCTVIGNPQPTIEWFFNESLIVDDYKHKVWIFQFSQFLNSNHLFYKFIILLFLFQIFYENGLCQLTIRKIDLTDLGEYACVASNEHDTDRTCARLIAGGWFDLIFVFLIQQDSQRCVYKYVNEIYLFVLATPAPPGRPEVELSSDTEVFITWEAPQMSHALDCFMYRLEVRLAGI